MDKQHKVNTLRAYPIFLTNISADVLLELQGGLQLHDVSAVQRLHQWVGAGAGRAALDPAGGYLDISVDQCPELSIISICASYKKPL